MDGPGAANLIFAGLAATTGIIATNVLQMNVYMIWYSRIKSPIGREEEECNHGCIKTTLFLLTWGPLVYFQPF
ncbi:hypothetical protein RHMOL_Rhmol05G0264900 [Rhododendron molle]|uniref:Uncharacterized protein n=1 Tax=Rhododendron molle TaxID=49168 RepID=A0ACC0NUZ0_RHOML|nr:hypothetical protein RHMOL_Rhmol05G0264900 [Rhododendron molle]